VSVGRVGESHDSFFPLSVSHPSSTPLSIPGPTLRVPRDRRHLLLSPPLLGALYPRFQQPPRHVGRHGEGADAAGVRGVAAAGLRRVCEGGAGWD
jgi:hypothetical protein